MTGGPCSGETWTLGDGLYRIGRDPSSEVHLGDPSLSREHASFAVRGASVTITDVGSSNGVAIDGKAILPDGPQPLLPRIVVELGRTLIQIHPLNADPSHELTERGRRVEFQPASTDQPHLRVVCARAAGAAQPGGKARLPLVTSAVPLVMGVAMFLLLKSPFMLVMCSLSPVMAVTTYVTDRHGGMKSFRRSSAQFRERAGKAVSSVFGSSRPRER